jgi:hypothetical protein
MPALGGNATSRAWDGGQQLVQTEKAVGRESDGGRGGVDDPAKNKLTCGPSAVAFAKFFLGGRFLSMGAVAGFEWAEDTIQGVEELALDATSSG